MKETKNIQRGKTMFKELGMTAVVLFIIFSVLKTFRVLPKWMD